MGSNSQQLVVLVIEGDISIQGIVEQALSEAGFELEIASSGEEAIALLYECTSKYRALVSDINLRGPLTGWEIAKRAREINGNIPVVYMSGAAAYQWASHGVPGSVVLKKPFAPAQLVTAVADLVAHG